MNTLHCKILHITHRCIVHVTHRCIIHDTHRSSRGGGKAPRAAKAPKNQKAAKAPKAAKTKAAKKAQTTPVTAGTSKGGAAPPSDPDTLEGGTDLLVSILPWVREFGDDLNQDEIATLERTQRAGMDSKALLTFNQRGSARSAYGRSPLDGDPHSFPKVLSS